MKRFLIVSVFIILPLAISHAYDVVLPDGKVVSGKLISETESFIVIKDSNGILVNFSKKDIDQEKTAERNQKEATNPALSKPKGRVYTKEDLEKAPELSITSSGDSTLEDEQVGENDEGDEEREADEPEEPEEPEEQEEADEDKDVPEKNESDEEFWRSEAKRLGLAIRNIETNLQDAQQQCETVTMESTDLTTVQEFAEKKRRACYRAESLKTRLESVKKEFSDFEREAREKGIPPGWYDPERQ